MTSARIHALIYLRDLFSGWIWLSRYFQSRISSIFARGLEASL